MKNQLVLQIRQHDDTAYAPEQKSIIDRITSRLQAIATAGPYDNFALGIDVSGYVDPKNVDLQKWHDEYGVEFLMAKMGDSNQMHAGDPYDPTNYVDRTFPVYCDMAYNIKNKHGGMGIPFGGYFYWRGRPLEVQSLTRDGDPQYKAFKAAFKPAQIGKSIHWVTMDLEDHGETNTNTSKKAKVWYHWMTGDPELNPIWRILYTSIGFIQTYTPDSMAWIGQANSDVMLHMAQWPWPGGKVMNWDKLEKPNGVSKVLSPGNNPNRKMWQWGGDIVGLCKNALDMNYYWGSWQELYAWLPFTPRSITPPPDHTCPIGQHWDEAAGGCVADVIVPPVDDTELKARVAELERWRKS